MNLYKELLTNRPTVLQTTQMLQFTLPINGNVYSGNALEVTLLCTSMQLRSKFNLLRQVSQYSVIAKCKSWQVEEDGFPHSKEILE